MEYFQLIDYNTHTHTHTHTHTPDSHMCIVPYKELTGPKSFYTLYGFLFQEKREDCWLHCVEL
jgi:hypothetical protein